MDLANLDQTTTLSTQARRSRAANAGVGLAMSLTLLLSACGGSSSIGAVDAMPAGASEKAVEKAEACDDGDLDSCNWLGIWYMVGGAGKERRREGVRYIQHACDEGLDKACKLMAALRKAANSQ